MVVTGMLLGPQCLGENQRGDHDSIAQNYCKNLRPLNQAGYPCCFRSRTTAASGPVVQIT